MYNTQFIAMALQHPHEDPNVKYVLSCIVNALINRQSFDQKWFDVLYHNVPIAGIFDTFDVQEFEDAIKQNHRVVKRTRSNCSIRIRK
ncbi:hypothetical protein VPEG_00053 [Vibrio phage SIO-2]|uniref:hypothetical protein n=1 Tax=Vibrio phage SIO-2 TaxID=700512 RepID=UPI0002357C5B|nr:hypothetical protein VPEG_00053 [Vibrio phage SIO-2]AET42204.1 hypothetical protein VPEG_00053 [Vibrio phage SIO-2]